jgi:hypothetical protein
MADSRLLVPGQLLSAPIPEDGLYGGIRRCSEARRKVGWDRLRQSVRRMVGALRRQCEDDSINLYSRMLALVFIPMGRKKFDAILFA